MRYLQNGDFICEYSGEQITDKEGLKRQAAYRKSNQGNFLYWCGKNWYVLSDCILLIFLSKIKVLTSINGNYSKILFPVPC